MKQFFESKSLTFFQRTLKAGVLSGVACTSLGACFLSSSRNDVADAIPAVTVAPTGLVVTSSALLKPVVTVFEQMSNWFSPKAVASLTSADMADSGGAPIVLSQAWIRLKEIEFKTAETGVEDSGEIQFQGPYIVDLLSASPSPIDNQSLPVQEYRRITFKLDHEGALGAGDPAQLENHSMYLDGTVGGVNFSYVSADGSEVEIGGPNGITPDTNGMLLVIRFAEAFKNIDMSAVTAGVEISESNRVAATNPCPAIEDGAADIYTCIRKGLEKTAELGKDSEEHDLDHAGAESTED